jgi:nucleoid-associated protein YgaU
MTMGKMDAFEVKANKEKAPVFRSNEKNKKGRPVMVEVGTYFDKGEKSTVDATAKFSAADSGDGIIHADGGDKFYSMVGIGPVFLRVEDFDKTGVEIDYKQSNQRTYTVKAGDTLSGIALHFYENGDFEHYDAIYKANKAILKSRDHIEVGQKLIIPAL